MKKIVFASLFVTLAAIGYVLISNAGRAHASEENLTGYLVLSPSKVQLGTLEPGLSYTESIEAFNSGQAPISFDVSAETLTAGEDYAMTWGVAPSQHNKITDWVSFKSGAHYELEPGAKTKVEFTVKVPKDAAGGAQHFMLLAKLAGNQTGGKSGWDVEAALGIQVYSNINGDINFKGKLLSQSIQDISFAPSISTTSAIENTGNTDWIASYRLNVTNAFSGETAVDETKADMFILAGTKRVFEHRWDNAPALGVFNVTQEISYINENGEQVTDTFKKLTFIIPLWLIIIVAAMVVLVIISIIFRRRQNKMLKSKKPSWEQ